MKQWTDTVLTVGGIKEFKFHYVQMKPRNRGTIGNIKKFV